VVALYIWHARILRAGPIRIAEVRRATYRTSVGLSWAFTALVLLHWMREERAWSGMLLGLPVHLRFWTTLAAGGAAAAFLAWQRQSLLEDPESRREVARQLGAVEPILPRTPAELRWFAAVSVTAGICEEILYRGFILAYLRVLVPLPAAVILSAVLFGMAHAYQGTRGILQTAGVGLVLGALALFGGSLWVPMALHAFVDLNSGALAYGVLRDEGAAPGEPGEPG
jgi:membrane protease YdiL (CAAX protease family)